MKKLQSSAFIISGPIIHSLAVDKLEIIRNGTIVVDKGKIVDFAKDVALNDFKKKHGVADENVRVLRKEELLIPGFIDTHIHAPQYPNCGLGYDLTLLDWLEKYTFPMEKRFRDERFAERVYDAVVRQTVLNGTTTSTYFATIHNKSSVTLARTAQKYGQRAYIGKVNMTVNSPLDYCESYDESIANTKSFVEEIIALKNPLIKPIITPRFAVSCDMKTMKSLSEIARTYDLPIQSHVSENQKELELVQQLYPECKNYVDVYDKAGLLTDKTILAHGVYLKPEEIAVLNQKKTGIVHCANSNCSLQSGLCPVRKLLESGLKVSLGTDCSGGYSCSMIDAIRDTLFSSVQAQLNGGGRRLSYGEAFYLATLGGAQALSIDNITGNFKVGKEFDAIIVNCKYNQSVNMFDEYSPEEMLQKFIYTGDDRWIEQVFAAGAIIKH